jgi:hypothetical protein
MTNLYVKDAGTWVDFGATGTTPTSLTYTVDGFLTIPTGITRATVVINGGRGSGGNNNNNGGGTNGGYGGTISVTFDVSAGELYYIQYINGAPGEYVYGNVQSDRKYTGNGGSTMAFGPWTGSLLAPSGVWIVAGAGGGGGAGPGTNEFLNAGWPGGGNTGGGANGGTQSSGFSQFLGGGASGPQGGGAGGSGWWGGGAPGYGGAGTGGSGGSSYNGVPAGRNPVLNQNGQGTNTSSNDPFCSITLA